jgi:hypothetical protein
MDDRCWMQNLAAVPHLEAPVPGQVAPASGHDPQDERRPLYLETFRLATDPGPDCEEPSHDSKGLCRTLSWATD